MVVSSARTWVVLCCFVLALAALAPRAWRGAQLNARLSAVHDSLRTNQLAEARDVLLRLERENPNQAEVAFLSGVCQRRLTAISLARDYFKKAGDLGWPRKEILLEEAMCDFPSGDKAAETFLLESLKESHDDETANEIYECLVRGYLAGLYMAEASYCIDTWLAWRPDAIVPRKLRAEIFNVIQDHGQEAEAYREVLRVDPDDLDAHLKLGQLLLDMHSPAEALEEFRRCQALSPDDANVKIFLAACQRTLGELAEAETLLRESLDGELFSSERAFALVELGQVVLANQSVEEAVGLLEEAVRLAPSDRTAHYALGLTLARMGQEEEGNTHIERSIKIDHQNDRLSDLTHQIVRAPEDPAPRSEAGEILLDQQRYEESYLWLLSALRCDKTHQRTHEALARYYSATGKPDAAERHLAWAADGGGPAAISNRPTPIVVVPAAHSRAGE
jgi:tetratricopeptide (TPR) repeat protein